MSRVAAVSMNATMRAVANTFGNESSGAISSACALSLGCTVKRASFESPMFI